MKEIPLTRGLVALVDDEDYDELSKHAWRASSKGYAQCAAPHPIYPGKRTTLLMHRVILGLKYGDRREGDHADLNKQNNQRYNLRIATRSQNACNQKITLSANTSGYKGVTWHKGAKKWQASIRIDGKLMHLGHFDNPENAHNAYCKAAHELHGEFARTE